MHIDTRKDHLDGMMAQLGIQHFTADELGRLTHPDWDGPDYALPEYEALGNIQTTLLLADRIRARWGAGVQVVSGYRPPEYNRLVGGSPNSQHCAFRALDLKPVEDGFDLDRFFRICTIVVECWRERGVNVGYGRYYEGRGRFAHIDTSAHTGVQREWIKTDE